jgi:hypothetical protein
LSEGWARCAVSRPLDGDVKRCESPATVEFRGARLCAPHAAMLEAGERMEHWEEAFFHMEIWLHTARELDNKDLVGFLEPGRMLSEIKLNQAQEKLDRAKRLGGESADFRHLRLVG